MPIIFAHIIFILVLSFTMKAKVVDHTPQKTTEVTQNVTKK